MLRKCVFWRVLLFLCYLMLQIMESHERNSYYSHQQDINCMVGGLFEDVKQFNYTLKNLKHLFNINIMIQFLQFLLIQLMNVKELMLEYFQQPQVSSLLEQYIKTKQLKLEDLTDDELMKMIDDLQLLNPLNQQIETNENLESKLPLDMFQIENNRKNLKIVIQKGRNFINFKKAPLNSKFFISICGLQERCRTSSYALSENFSIPQTLILSVNPNLLTSNNNRPLQLAVIILQNNGNKSIYSVKNVQWRYLLSYGSTKFDIQLAPYYHQGIGQIPCIGILSLKLQLTPWSKLNILPQRVINHEFQLQKKNKQVHNKKFYEYANDFWNEYKTIHRSFAMRRVRIYGDCQDKIYIPMCRFVHPLYNVRGIDSPNHALRFVSLLGFQEPMMNRKSMHKRFHTMLAGSTGSIDDHSHLLCSLLLGLGLKAYVCLGHSYKGQHSWVITIEKNNIKFWQPTKGVKYDFYSTKTYDFYKDVHIIYNHKEFYANTQLDDSISGTKFNFEDRTCWKQMDNHFLEILPPYNTEIAFMPATFDSNKIQKDIQFNVCKKIAEFRKKNKLGFDHDPILASILMTALANYQVQRVTGQTFCEEEFQTAVKNYIPLKHTFKAFPIQLKTLDPEQIMQTLRNQQKCKQIILSKGDSLHFAIKVKLILFPQNIFALWLSLAVRFYKID